MFAMEALYNSIYLNDRLFRVCSSLRRTQFVRDLLASAGYAWDALTDIEKATLLIDSQSELPMAVGQSVQDESSTVLLRVQVIIAGRHGNALPQVERGVRRSIQGFMAVKVMRL
jgi:hypothetical protein